MMPPASMATKNSASAITPGTRYCMNSLWPYTSTRWTSMRGADENTTPAVAAPPGAEANAPRSTDSITFAEVLSVLSPIAASGARAELLGHDHDRLVGALAQPLDRHGRRGLVRDLEQVAALLQRAQPVVHHDRRAAVILVDQRDPQIVQVATHGLAEDHEVDDRHERHGNHERTVAPEAAQIALGAGQQAARLELEHANSFHPARRSG